MKEKFLSQLAGYSRVKKEFEELLDMLHHQDKYKEHGASLPSGILIYGVPGVGKTAMVRELLDASRRKIYEIVLEDISNESHINRSIKLTFDKAKKTGNAIVFIDDLDLMLLEKDSGREGINIELKYLLKEIDEAIKNDIIVIAAVNNYYYLDKALIRSGRFDRKIQVDLPEEDDRKAIIQFYLSKTSIKATDKLIDQMIKSTSGKSGSDIKLIINEMIIKAVAAKSNELTRDIYEYAYDRVSFSDVNKGFDIKEKHIERMAYHEIGHAITSLVINYDNFDKVSLSKQANSLGHLRNSNRDFSLKFKSDLEKEIMIGLSGFLTEEIIYNDPSTLAIDDLRKSMKMADYYIRVCGFANVSHVEYKLSTFESNESENRKMQIEEKLEDLIDKLICKAKQILMDNRENLDIYAKKLIKKGFLYLDDFNMNKIIN